MAKKEPEKVDVKAAEPTSTLPPKPAVGDWVSTLTTDDGQVLELKEWRAARSRVETVAGQSYEVCRVNADGTWVYRAVAF